MIVQAATKGSDSIPLDPLGAILGAEKMSAERIIDNWESINAIILWGYLRGQATIYKKALNEGKRIYYVDHAYFGANRDYWKLRNQVCNFRVTIDARQPKFKKSKPDRFAAFNLALQKYQGTGTVLLYSPPSKFMLRFFPKTKLWHEKATGQARAYARKNGLRFIVRDKGARNPIQWHDVALLATHSSNLAVDAILRGIPIAVSDESACAACSTQIGDMYAGGQRSYLEVCNFLAYNQFTTDEMRDGTALKILEGKK